MGKSNLTDLFFFLWVKQPLLNWEGPDLVHSNYLYWPSGWVWIICKNSTQLMKLLSRVDSDSWSKLI